jgi:hypothetical protein
MFFLERTPKYLRLQIPSQVNSLLELHHIMIYYVANNK